MLPEAAPSSQMARLMSMEELTSSVMGRQNAEEARLRLLRVDPPIESTRRATTPPTLNSSKRQSHLCFHAIDFLFFKLIILLTIHCVVYRRKRREEKAERGRKAEVTFRPDESIIPTQEVEQYYF